MPERFNAGTRLRTGPLPTYRSVSYPVTAPSEAEDTSFAYLAMAPDA